MKIRTHLVDNKEKHCVALDLLYGDTPHATYTVYTPPPGIITPYTTLLS